MKNSLIKTYKAAKRKLPRPDDSLKIAIGHLETSLQKQSRMRCLKEAEFKVFSQWGEDGIIQYLTSEVEIENDIFVEFGVQDYSESNTRFLLINNNWSGLIIDADNAHKDFLHSQNLSWKYDIRAASAFITKDNINQLIGDAGIQGSIGLLSVDIDGVDYWILKEIDVVRPQIVIVEYNAFMGCEHAVSVPYKENFYRTTAHFSNFYWGASLPAFHHLLTSRNYKFVGCNTAGNNAFFVSSESASGAVEEVSLAEGFVDAKFWEYRQKDGSLDDTRDRTEYFKLIADLPIVDVVSDETKKISDFDFD